MERSDGLDLFQIDRVVQSSGNNRILGGGWVVEPGSESMPGYLPGIHHGRLAVDGCEFVWHLMFLRMRLFSLFTQNIIDLLSFSRPEF